MRKVPFLILLALLTLGCVTVMGPLAASTPTARLPTFAAPTAAEPVRLPTALPAAGDGPTVTVTPRSRMTATDPSTVRLDDGQLKLVEFFGFW